MSDPAPTPPPPVHGHLSRRALALRALVGLAALAVLVAAVASVDFRRDLSYVKARLLTGAESGNYHALGMRIAAVVGSERGRVDVVTTEGSVDNVRRLAAASKSCDVAFALVQDGTGWDASARLELVGRLVRGEAVVLLGKRADAVAKLADLAHAKIGIGPDGSGTARVGRQLFGDPALRTLDLHLETHPIDEQVALAEKGELDFALVVIDEDADVLVNAVRNRGLGVVDLAQAEVLAHRVSSLHAGKIPAGAYDPVALLPPTDKRTLFVETLVVGNRCAGRSQTIGLLSAIAKVQPGFVRHNRETANPTGLPLASASKGFFENDGPEVFDEYVPWLVDVMPPGNWAYIVMAVSVLFNAMGAGHRFRLWRIDAARVKAEADLTRFFPPGTTLGDIDRMQPEGPLLDPAIRRGLRGIVDELEDLAQKSRRQSLSMLVPMGQEMAYRYQESLIYKTVAVLRAFDARAANARPSASEPASERASTTLSSIEQ